MSANKRAGRRGAQRRQRAPDRLGQEDSSDSEGEEIQAPPADPADNAAVPHGCVRSCNGPTRYHYGRKVASLLGIFAHVQPDINCSTRQAVDLDVASGIRILCSSLDGPCDHSSHCGGI
ncbi:unnamed protein product [Cylindrotheca closterium]|uniref:Uncharacterized protein n=1 Tax=Cylindrotheca closterium TaxID=2856 RepID=A0AAD2G5X2_9STRA|nr:unnamed protein product [Cylindrotheca closterium]